MSYRCSSIQICGSLALVLYLLLSTARYSFGQELPRANEIHAPSEQDRMIAKRVSELIVKHHVSSHPMDDEISLRAFDFFLRQFDPMKIYFTQSDLVEFRNLRDSIDDRVQQGDVQFAYDLFHRFLQRMKESIPVIHEWIAFEHDFTLVEELELDPRLLDHPASVSESRERWRKSIKHSLLKLKQEGKGSEEARKILHLRTAEDWNRWEQTDTVELLEHCLTSITKSFDPYSSYKGPRSQDGFNMALRLELQGIGAKLESREGATWVTSIVPGGAADRDGRLKPGDQITAIGQEGEDPTPIQGKRLEDVVSMIRGQAGTKVRLTIEPNGGGVRQVLEIVRAQIQLQEGSVYGQVVNHGSKQNGEPYQFGWIGVPSFYRDSDGERANQPNFRSATRDLRRILLDMKGKGVDGIILDLSKNDRGALSEAIESASMFIDRGPIVQIKSPKGPLRTMEDVEPGTVWDGPLVVITSKMSVSASEVFAGVIRTYERGLIVGDPHTHGKGTVQSILEIDDPNAMGDRKRSFGALKVSSQQFFLADGSSTQSQGVPSDIVLPSIAAVMKTGESELEFAMPASQVPPLDFERDAMVQATQREKLQQHSTARCQADIEFAKRLSQIEAYKKHRDDHVVRLNEIQFRIQANEFDKSKMEDAVFTEFQRVDSGFQSNFYNREILQISVDYLQMLKSNGSLK